MFANILGPGPWHLRWPRLDAEARPGLALVASASGSGASGLRLWPRFRTRVPAGLPNYLWGSALNILDEAVAILGCEGHWVLHRLVPPMVQQTLSGTECAVPDDVLPWLLWLVGLWGLWVVCIVELLF